VKPGGGKLSIGDRISEAVNYLDPNNYKDETLLFNYNYSTPHYA
jgi:hypothetical protein